MYGEGGRLRDLDNLDIDNSKKNAMHVPLIISEKCEITVNQKIKDTEGTYLLRLKNQFIASNFKPGQFVMLKANSHSFEPLLSRPFSIFNKFDENEFEVLYRVYGKGTYILSKITKGNFLNVVGPLGNGFNFNGGDLEKKKIHVLIAGGIGIAPLYSIPGHIFNNYRFDDNAADSTLDNEYNGDKNGKDKKDKIILYYGARRAEELYFRYSIHSRFDEVYFATDDGSFGFKGSVVELLFQNMGVYLDKNYEDTFVSFYSCGPKPMLSVLVDRFERFEDAKLLEKLQLSLEESFGCGIGVCLGCVIKCKDFRGNGSNFAYTYKRVCKDGPVFYAGELYDFVSKNNDLKTASQEKNKKQDLNKDQNINLSVKLGNLKLDYPIMSASGTFGYGEEFINVVDYTYFGALVTKGISLNPSEGNEMPRICESPCGLINSIGLQNVGFERFKDEKLPFLKRFNKPIIVNFFGKSVEEYVLLAEKLSGLQGISALEANISCPNIKEGGRSFGSDPEIVYELISSVKEVIGDKLPLIAKLTPMVNDISFIAEVCEKAGADIISLINTILSASIDIKTKSFKLNRGFGGLSGPAVKPIALKLVNDVYNSVRIPIIGMGGISSWEDAVEFFLAGATAVAVGTYSFINPKIIPQIVEGVKKYLMDNWFNDIHDIIGFVNKNKRINEDG